MLEQEFGAVGADAARLTKLIYLMLEVHVIY